MVKSHERFSNSLQKYGKENRQNRHQCPIDTDRRSNVKSVGFQNPHVVVVMKFGVIGSRPRHLTNIYNYKIHRQQSLRNNMLTKYQTIKFIDFCEVWFLPESVARVAAIVGDHHCHTPRH
ncbi:hypothetical protein TNCV_2206841 [Trichonephila clavipes]|uniref:Uncharacterized protein n=1 Tax=Trichonephila clavipes TaxID=2585209 RepID=A0A8X6SDY2_TRICX|nr:hypothetical protein TNCV_2206841 [Trichonephila clavipes]